MKVSDSAVQARQRRKNRKTSIALQVQGETERTLSASTAQSSWRDSRRKKGKKECTNAGWERA